MLFGALPRAQNRGFWCSPSCIAFPRAKNRALDRAFWCSPSCQKSSFLVLSFVYCFPSCKKSCSRSCFLVLSLVHKIVVFGALPCAKNRALDRAFGALLRAKNRAFWCSPSCIAFPRAKNRALDRAFWCSPSCTKSGFLVLSLVPKSCFLALFGALPRAKNRALDRAFCSSLSPCLRPAPYTETPQYALLRAKNRGFWCSPSCHKSCFLVLSLVPKIVL